VGPVLGHGLLAIWIVVGLWRAAGLLAYGAMWRRRVWSQIEV